MLKNQFSLLLWIFIVLLFPNLSVNGQPGFSRQAGRFHFRQWIGAGDSSRWSIWVPNWFSFGSKQGWYGGAVNRYGLGPLTEWMAGGRLRSAGHSFRWDVVTVGNADHRQSQLQVGLVRSLNPSLWLGTGLGFSLTQVRGYGTSGSPTSHLFLGGLLSDRTVWGMSWENPQSLLSQKGWYGTNPLRVRAGIAYSFSSRLCLYGGVDWERVASAAALVRATYQLNAEWVLELGWGWLPDQLIVGVHRSFRGGRLGLGFSQDPVLGPGFSFFSAWDRDKKN